MSIFDIFKNHTAKKNRGKAIVDLYSSALSLQLQFFMLPKVDSVGYKNMVESLFFRGYVFGWFDASLQFKFKNNPFDETEYLNLIGMGFIYLSNPETLYPLFIKKEDALHHFVTSTTFLNNEEFRLAQKNGAKDFFEWIYSNKNPLGLAAHFNKK